MRGLIVNGRFMGWAALQQSCVCRKCRTRIGRSYADPITGELDHERMVCAGPHEHEIRSQADIMSRQTAEWLAERERAAGETVLASYPWLDKRPTLPAGKLYEDFEGYDAN